MSTSTFGFWQCQWHWCTFDRWRKKTVANETLGKVCQGIIGQPRTPAKHELHTWGSFMGMSTDSTPLIKFWVAVVVVQPYSELVGHSGIFFLVQKIFLMLTICSKKLPLDSTIDRIPRGQECQCLASLSHTWKRVEIWVRVTPGASWSAGKWKVVTHLN